VRWPQEDADGQSEVKVNLGTLYSVSPIMHRCKGTCKVGMCTIGDGDSEMVFLDLVAIGHLGRSAEYMLIDALEHNDRIA
jgi:hypothetical protein